MKNVMFPMILSCFVLGTASFHAAAATTNAPSAVAPASAMIGHNPILTPADFQELQLAHLAALKANPGLAAKSAQLADKMRDFQRRFELAMIETDPKVEIILEKLKAARSASQATEVAPKTR